MHFSFALSDIEYVVFCPCVGHVGLMLFPADRAKPNARWQLIAVYYCPSTAFPEEGTIP